MLYSAPLAESPAPPSGRRTWLTFTLVVFHFLLATGIAGGVLGWEMLQDVRATLPDIAEPGVLLAKQSMRISDRYGNELYRVFQEEDRTWLSPEEIPMHMRNAVVAIEDRRFFTRPCVDARALLRAGWNNLRDYKSQGASTITQQLVRAVFLTREKTFARKVREMLLACELERYAEKQEILDLYLNWISFGQNIYGVEQASRRYFGMPARQLSLAQAAVLASLPQRPSYFSPYGPHRRTTVSDPLRAALRAGAFAQAEEIPQAEVTPGLIGIRTRAGKKPVILKGRANTVLERMEAEGFISPEERAAAERELLTLAFEPDIDRIAAPHFVLSIREQIPGLLAAVGTENLPYTGLTVRTSLDPALQALAEESVRDFYPRIREHFGAKNVALVAVDLRTNEILAYVGNWNYFDEVDEGKIDMARAPRQPGSSFKPFVYAAAFLKGYGPNSYVRDEPITIGNYRPRNYEGGYFGRMKVKDALARSRNIPAIKAYYWAGGEDAVLDVAAKAGIVEPSRQKERRGPLFRYGWPLALGSAETPLTEMLQGYATLARDGNFTPVTGILSITDKDGRLLHAPDRSAKPALPASVARDLTAILSDTEARPQGYWRDKTTLPGTEAAVKTGTSSVCVLPGAAGKCMALAADNAWALGYTPELLVGVWAGNADKTPLFEDADGLTAAIPLWRDFFLKALAARPPRQTLFPRG